MMRWTALVFAMALGLSACGSSATTPLGRAIVALRTGDRDAFLKAKADADEAKHGAWQAGMDRCKVTGEDFEKHGEAAILDALDKPDLFKLSEEARFVYVGKVAGELDAPMRAAERLPTMQSWFGGADNLATGNVASLCMSGMVASGMQNPLSEGQPGELERRALLKDWLDSLVSHYGAAKFDDAMHDAVALLDRNGYSAQWPENIEFVDDPNIKTFGQVEAEISGAAH